MPSSRRSKKQQRDSREAGWRKKLAREYREETKETARGLSVTTKVLREKFYHPTEKDWIEKRVKEIRYQNFELPSGTFQEPQAALIAHQQKYLQALIQISPE